MRLQDWIKPGFKIRSLDVNNNQTAWEGLIREISTVDGDLWFTIVLTSKGNRVTRLTLNEILQNYREGTLEIQKPNLLFG